MSGTRKLRSIAAIAFGLAVLVSIFILAIPSDRLEQASRSVPSEKPADEPAEGESASDAPEEVRSVRPQPRRDAGQGALRRIAPREPLSEIAAPASAPDNPIEDRLLPRPVALDSGRLQVGEGIVVLPGIEALPPDAVCDGADGRWPCGAHARTAIRAFLRGRSVECVAPRNFGTVEETITSACTLAGDDVAGWVVANGWARAEPGSSYSDLEADARDARLGLWR